MERLFVDTGAWYALGNRADPAHDAVAAALKSFSGRLVTSNFVFDETIALCVARRRGHAAAARLGAVLLAPAVVDLVHITTDDERAAWRLFLERPDQPYSFTDCTSFTLLRRLGVTQAAALDEHFRIEGFNVVPRRPRR